MLNALVSADGGAMPARQHLQHDLPLDPRKMPDRYAMRAAGRCMEPIIADGTLLLMDRTLPVQTGDLVTLFRRPEFVRPGEYPVLLKRILVLPPPDLAFPCSRASCGPVRHIVLVEQLNPFRQIAIPCEALLGFHKCLGPVPSDVPTYLEQTERYAWEGGR